ncbi:MAG: helix-turn-helix transcriptional regulator [Eubacterium sp.]|jgi:toxin-antitoxin system, antitoxin component, xre family|nr:helix-turn-helix transcriptional regulator [Eubacterium sp.]
MIKDLPEKLRLLRLEKKYTQKELAKLLDVSPSIVSGYETGERTPSLENLKALATLYDCSADYLLGVHHEEPSITIDTAGLTLQQITVLQDLISVMKDK